jgi:outer membrane lipoprotein SlyB
MNPNEKAARRRDNAIAAGAVLAGGGVAAGGYGAIRAAKSIKTGVADLKQTTSHVRDTTSRVADKVSQTADQVGGQVAKTGAAVRQTSRRAGRAATAPSRAVAKGARAGGKLVSKLKKFFKMQAELQATELAKIPLRGATLHTAQSLAGLHDLPVATKSLRKRHVMKPLMVSDKKSLKDVSEQSRRIRSGVSRSAGKWSAKNPGRHLEGMPDSIHRRQSVVEAVDDYLDPGRHPFYKKERKANLEAYRDELHEFRASEIEKGTMNVNGTIVSVEALEKRLAGKAPVEVPWKSVKGMARQKGLSKDRLKNVAPHLDKPGIILEDGTLVDGRHRSRMRKASGMTHGIYRKASKADIKAAAVQPTQLSAKIQATYFMMASVDPAVQEEKKKRKKQIRGIGRLLRLQFESKPNREERIAGHIADGVGLTKAAASGAVTGSMVGGPVGAAVGGVAGIAGQAGMHRVAKKKENDRKPLQGAAARAAIPAALVTGGAILKNTEKGKRMMKKTKAVGRLVRRNLKNLEAQLDEVIEFKTGDSLIKGAKKAAKAGTEAAGKSLKWRQKVARKVAGIRDGESVVGISKTGQRAIRAAGVAGGVAPLAVMAHKAKKSEGKAKDEHNEHLSKAMLRKNIIRTKSQRKEDRDADKKFLKGSYNRTGAIVGSAGGAIAGGSVGGLNGAYIGSQAGGIAGAHLGGLIDRKPKKKKELSLVARLTELEANLDRLTELSKSKQWIKAEGEHRGSYEETQRVLDGRVKPTIRNPNYDPKAFPGSAHSQPFKDDDTPIGINQQAWRASERKAKTAVKWGGRAKNAASDLKDVVTGKPRKKDQAGRAKKREWEKSYAKNAIATGIATGGIMAGNAYLRKNPEKRDAIYGAVERGTAGIIKKGKKVMAAAFSEGPLRRGMIHEFVSVRDDSGRQVFRVEDARGNSARIHAGDKPKRDRRPKRWNEKVENERKLWGAGVVAAGGAGLVAGAKGKEIAKATKESKLYQGVKKSKVGQQVAQGVERMVSPKRRLIREIAKQGARAVN